LSVRPQNIVTIQNVFPPSERLKPHVIDQVT